MTNKSKNKNINNLYKEYYNDYVYRVYKQIGNHYDAEDVVSELFFNMIKNEPAKKINEKYLSEACNDMIKKYLSKQKSNNNKYSFILRDPLELMLEQEAKEVLVNYIRNYNKKYSKVMEMYFVKQIKPFKIGKILGIKGNTVVHKIKRGTILLQEYLIKKGY